jgi:peptidoglycan hydrolase-like protein with peptidoglycan-binding domain
MSDPSVFGLQQTIGNAATLQRLGVASAQRAPEKEKETPEQKQAARKALAEQIIGRVNNEGGITVSFHMMNAKNDNNDAEFQRQADQFAIDHGAIGLAGSTLKSSVSMPINDSIGAKLTALSGEIDKLMDEFPELYETKPVVKIHNLSIFTHGTKTALEIGANQTWLGASQMEAIASGMAPHLASSPIVNLFACSTAGNAGTNKKNFATALQEKLNEKLEEQYGEGAHASVWGHTTAAHTVFNRNLVGVGAGGALAENLGARMLDEVLIKTGKAGNVTDTQNAALLKDAAAQITATFSEAKATNDPAYKTRYQYYTLATDIQLAYFREIGLIGMDQAWKDISTDEAADYSALGLTPEATKRVEQGRQFFRDRFKPRYTTFESKVSGTKPANEQPTPKPVKPSNGGNERPEPSDPTTINLSRGSQGTRVIELQTLLNGRPYIAPKLDPDGAYGRLTYNAVALFQAKEKLPVTGAVNAATWERLHQPAAPTPQVKPAPQNNQQPKKGGGSSGGWFDWMDDIPNPIQWIEDMPNPLSWFEDIPNPLDWWNKPEKPNQPAKPNTPGGNTQPNQPAQPIGDLANWPQTLPTMKRNAQNKIGVTLSDKKEGPALSNNTIGPDTPLTDAQRALVQQIAQNRQGTDISKLFLTRYAGKYGYAYMGTPDKDATPTSLQGAATDKNGQAERWIWEELRHEGGTSSINAYDSQMVTWGRGLGAKSGPMLTTVMNELFKDSDIAAAFLRQGISYNNGLMVVNTETGAIETGNNALALIQADPHLLGTLIQIAENPAFHQKVTDAQWKGTQAVGTGRVPEFALDWPKELIQMVAHITHWGPAYGWHYKASLYRDVNGDALKTVLAFLRAAAGGANANGAYSFRNPDATTNLSRWGGGIGLNTIKSNFREVYLNDDEINNDASLKDCYVLQDGNKRNAQKQKKCYVYP